MRKIAIALSKGGVGKTTTAVNLADCLARSGRRILLIDTDTQAQCSRLLGVKPAAAGLAELLEDVDVSPMSIRENLWFLPGSQDLAQAKRLIARRDVRSEEVLSEKLGRFDGKYDFVILDTSPGWDSLSINVLFYAEEILCPVSMEVLAVDGFLAFLQNVELIRKYRDVKIGYILPTFIDGRVRKSQEILEQLIVHFGKRVCNPIRYSVKLSRAPGYGETIFEYAPKDRGSLDYAKLAGRILRDG